MYGYIYLIVNKINGKSYVGKKVLKRKEWHSDNYMGSGKHLKVAQAKYGIENFEKFLICYTNDEKDACEKEIFWIAEYRSRGKAEYNIAKGGHDLGIVFGHPVSEETKRKLSESNKGQIPWNKGKHLSEEDRKKKSLAATGRKITIEERKKLSEAHKGYVMPEEQKQKISNSLKGKYVSEETRQKLSLARKNYFRRLRDKSNKNINGENE